MIMIMQFNVIQCFMRANRVSYHRFSVAFRIFFVIIIIIIILMMIIIMFDYERYLFQRVYVAIQHVFFANPI